MLRGRVRSRTETALRRALSTPTGSLPDHQLVIEPGEPAHVLLEHANAAAMIVIGLHDQPLLQRLVAHHTSRYLLHASAVPVVVVPSAARPAP